MKERQKILACEMGLMEYHAAWTLQRQLQDRLIRAKRSEPAERLDHLLLLVEHPPVYTLGKSGDRTHLLLKEEDLHKQGASFVHIDRGGDITYHGPGQLVGYPILDLDRFYTDIHRYLRDLEEVIMRCCASYALSAGRSEGRTGVWIEADERGLERKIAAMGIRCSRWVTMHGFAFNVNTDLGRYDAIVPCGISDRGVTSLRAELGREVDEREVRTRIVDLFGRVFDAEMEFVGSDGAYAAVAAYLADEAELSS